MFLQIRCDGRQRHALPRDASAEALRNEGHLNIERCKKCRGWHALVFVARGVNKRHAHHPRRENYPKVVERRVRRMAARAAARAGRGKRKAREGYKVVYRGKPYPSVRSAALMIGAAMKVELSEYKVMRAIEAGKLLGARITIRPATFCRSA